jgi:hypothetical protein
MAYYLYNPGTQTDCDYVREICHQAFNHLFPVLKQNLGSHIFNHLLPELSVLPDLQQTKIQIRCTKGRSLNAVIWTWSLAIWVAPCESGVLDVRCQRVKSDSNKATPVTRWPAGKDTDFYKQSNINASTVAGIMWRSSGMSIQKKYELFLLQLMIRLSTHTGFVLQA